MIKEVRFDGNEPSVAYTDFSAIYLSNSLFGKDLETAKKHELSHIWLQHQSRLSELKKNTKDVDHLIWNIAADLEIAKHIYDQQDEATIASPFSMLKGGIRKKHVADYKSEYAEGFYEELMKQSDEIKEMLKSMDAAGNKMEEEQEGEQEGESQQQKPVEEVVKEAQQKNAEEKEKAENRKRIKQVHESIKSFKAPKPSLASEIDSVFGRNKITRVKSYRRPSRVESEFLQKGRVSKKKAARFALYVDRSGSFDNGKTMEATRKIAEIVTKYRGKIEKDVFYFNNNLLTVDPMVGSGGTNYQAVVDDIIRNQAELSIIITDDDYCHIEFDKKRLPKVLVVPVGCSSTVIAKVIGAYEAA